MVTIVLERQYLVATIAGLSHEWGHRRRLEIPLRHVQVAELLGRASRALIWVREGDEQRLLASGVGTFLQGRELAFWCVHDHRNAVAIELANERYARLVLEVAHPIAVIARINCAIAHRIPPLC